MKKCPLLGRDVRHLAIKNKLAIANKQKALKLGTPSSKEKVKCTLLKLKEYQVAPSISVRNDSVSKMIRNRVQSPTKKTDAKNNGGVNGWR